VVIGTDCTYSCKSNYHTVTKVGVEKRCNILMIQLSEIFRQNWTKCKEIVLTYVFQFSDISVNR